MLFNDREVCEMVFDLLASRGDKRAVCGPRIELGEDDGAPVIRMNYSGRDLSDRNTLQLAGREALAAAILYCRTHHVPLPMKADKTLQIIRGTLTLVLSSASAIRT